MSWTNPEGKKELKQETIEAIKILNTIIDRMSGNSQRIKTYFLAITGAMSTFIALYGLNNINLLSFLLSYSFIALVFCYQDAKYLILERQFRQHHNTILSGTISINEQFDFNPRKYKADNVLSVMFTNFSTKLYLVLIIAVYLLAVLQEFSIHVPK